MKFSRAWQAKLTLLACSFLNMSKPTKSLSVSRANFLSSGAATFLTSAAVLASDPEACAAAVGKDNPRYIERELEMKVSESSAAT